MLKEILEGTHEKYELVDDTVFDKEIKAPILKVLRCGGEVFAFGISSVVLFLDKDGNEFGDISDAYNNVYLCGLNK